VTQGLLVVDSSAIVAILTEEAEAAVFSDLLDARPISYCSSATFVETFMVLTSRIANMSVAGLAAALQTLAIEQRPVDAEQSALAADAFLRFGKGRHPAKLNLGDCFSYALAKSLDAPLLYKGEDFAKTDIVSALAGGVRS
jgi:ribonuclease VapC